MSFGGYVETEDPATVFPGFGGGQLSFTQTDGGGSLDEPVFPTNPLLHQHGLHGRKKASQTSFI